MNKDLYDVLIIDDDADQAESIKEILEEEKQFNIFIATNKSSALDIFKKNENIYVVLSDVKLGRSFKGEELYGTDLIPEFKKRRNFVKIILLTAYADISTAKQAVKYNAYDYIEKPIIPEILMDSIYKAIEHVNNELKLEDYKHNLEHIIEQKTKEIKRQNEMLNVIADNIPVGVWFINSDNEITFTNKRFHEIVGVRCNTSQCINWDMVFESLPINKVIQNKEAPGEWEGEVIINGEEKYVTIIHCPVSIDKEFVGVVGVIFDDTRRVKMLKSIREIKGMI